MLNISAAAREMKDRVKGGEGGGRREEVRKTQRDKERTWGGRTGLRRECTSTVHSFRAIRLRTRSGFHKNGNRE